MPELPSGTVSFLFTDIEGSTRRWEHSPAAMRAAVDRHFALLREAITAHGGHVVRTQGDGLCAAFATAPPALAAALAAQRALHTEPWPAGAAPLCRRPEAGPGTQATDWRWRSVWRASPASRPTLGRSLPCAWPGWRRAAARVSRCACAAPPAGTR